jgi:hypothetical protein
MEWGIYLHTVMGFSMAWPNKKDAKSSMKGFINDLNEKIMEL